MDQDQILQALSGLPLGRTAYYDSLPSTNDIAAGWLEAGCPDLSLAVADEQTAGRGRAGRVWHTERGQALAFSLALRPPFPADASLLPRMTALAALAVREALLSLGLPAQIKWPNDVLAGGRKVCGVLAEAQWSGADPVGVVLGIGINVNAGSVPAAVLNFPATSIETELGSTVERVSLLRDILERLIAWRARLGTDAFLDAWEAALAFRGEWVRVTGDPDGPQEGKVLGLDPDGALRLQDRAGKVHSLRFGEIRIAT